ncbi:hypothetical protein ACFRFU_43530 [Streptomyces sp. NPDC056704]|uniref:hypothetical protein n=1 Tax=Streptomyces sp. NPDC056704 TaxID=3345917 RepID=UPI00367788AF
MGRPAARRTPPAAGDGGADRPAPLLTVDLNGAPHVLVSTCTGGGSSTILRTLTAQLLHHGAHALVLDIKRISQPWARQLPTVTYRADVADIHDALVGLVDELRRRIDVADRHGDDVGLLRLVVVFESGDATLRKLARHWETVRRPGDPMVSPAFTALTDVLFAGAMVRMHVLFDGDPTLSVLGPEGREQFSTAILDLRIYTCLACRAVFRSCMWCGVVGRAGIRSVPAG